MRDISRCVCYLIDVNDGNVHIYFVLHDVRKREGLERFSKRQDGRVEGVDKTAS